MKLLNFDWSDKEWSSALVNQAKHETGQPMRIFCSPYLFNELVLQGFGQRQYTSAPTNSASFDPDVPELYRDGDIIWQTMTGIPDNAVIMSNLDTIAVFHGFKSRLLPKNV